MKKKGVIFTLEDAKRYGVIEALIEGKMTNGEAADALNLSKRQVQRMKKKVAQNGPCGLIHGNRGRPSSRVLPWKDHVISLVKEKYSDFNFSHLAETLEEEEHLLVSRETLRLWLRRENTETTTPSKEETTIRTGGTHALSRWLSPNQRKRREDQSDLSGSAGI